MKAMLLALAALVVAGWWYFRRQKAGRAAGQAQLERRASQSNSEYHAVAIRSPSNACDAARELEGVRFLASEAPKLPLQACDRQHCECRFQHYEDRRSGRDRRSPFASGGVPSGTGAFDRERRERAGRRADD
jgi:Tfp pilus assembly protein PilN